MLIWEIKLQTVKLILRGTKKAKKCLNKNIYDFWLGMWQLTKK